MGSPCELQLFAPAAHASRVADGIVADVERLEARYSRYRADSLLSAINRVAAAGGAIDVDDETAALLDYAATCHAESGGLFDVTSGILRRAWRFDRATLPTQADIDAILPCVGWTQLAWHRPTLSFGRPGMELDFGGVVKEYAVDRAVGLCRAGGVLHAVVNLGGDVGVVGPRGDGTPWLVGIRHPRADALAQRVAMRRGALASSGDYERCITVDGRRYGHILDPRSGWPVGRLAAVTVAADFCVVAGSAATIAMLKGDEGPRWLAGLGLAHLWIDVDGRAGGDLLQTA